MTRSVSSRCAQRALRNLTLGLTLTLALALALALTPTPTPTPNQVPGGAAFLSAQICAAGLFFYGYSEVAMQALANVHPVTRALVT